MDRLEVGIMDFTETVKTRCVYQDTRNTNSLWRQRACIWHPLTQRQCGNRFKVGDKVTLRIITPTRKFYISCTIVHIVPYHTAEQFLGSYTSDNAFKEYPFTHVLVLKP